VASIIGRGARFFLLGGLIFFFGRSIQQFIEDRFELLTILFSILLVVSVIVVFFIMRWRRANAVVELRQEQTLETD
jgi:membrane protein DedA with SNARE-associated domain